MDDINPDSDSFSLNMTREEVTALRAVAKEALRKTQANAPFLYSTEDETKMYPNITAQNRTISMILPLVLISFTPAPSIPHKPPQPKYSLQVMYPSV